MSCTNTCSCNSCMARSFGRRKSQFPADTGIPSGATFDFVASGANYKITYANFLTALNVTGSIEQIGDVTGTPILDTQGTVNYIRNLNPVTNSGLSIEVNADGGVDIEFDAQTSGDGVSVLNSENKIRKIKAGSGITVTLDGDDIEISLT